MSEEEKDLLILQPSTLQKQKELRYKELEIRGIREPELTRAVEAEFVDYPTPTDIESWPGPVTGIDLAGNINLDLIFASKEPPIIQPNTTKTEPFPTSSVNPYPNNPTPDPNSVEIQSNTYDITNHPAPSSSNWLGTSSKINSEPSMEGEEGFTVTKSIPEWQYPIEDSQIDFGINIPPIIIPPSGQFNEAVTPDKEKKKSLLKKLAPLLALLGSGISAISLVNDYISAAPEEPEERSHYFTYTPLTLIAKFTLSKSHKGHDVCNDYSGKSFDLLDTTDRPILPSEGKGYINLVHPHCHCSWSITKLDKPTGKLDKKQKSEFKKIKTHITKAANNHTLHTVKPDGDLSNRTRGTNPMKEAIGNIRNQVRWLTSSFITQAREAAESNGGVVCM